MCASLQWSGEDFGRKQETVFAHATSIRAALSTPPAKASSGRAPTSKTSTKRRLAPPSSTSSPPSSQNPRCLPRLGFPLPRQHRPHPPTPRARCHAQCQARGRRHHELLDQDHRPASWKFSRASTFCSSTTLRPACWPATTTWCRLHAASWLSAPARWSSSMASTARHCSTARLQKIEAMSFAPSGLRPCRSKRSLTQRRRRQLCRSFFVISLRSLSRRQRLAPCYVLRQRHGLLRLRALRHRASAADLAR